MTRFLFWLFTIILMVATSFAADLTQAIDERELAKRLQFYQSIATLDVEFKQVKTLPDLKVKLESEGKLKLMRPDQVIWEITKPSRVLIQFKDRQVRVESGIGAEQSVQTWKLDDMPKGKDSKSINALMPWLQLDANALSKLYKVSSLGPNKLRFDPKEPDKSAFKRIEITLSSNGRLDLLHIEESSGDEMDIHFKTPTTTLLRR